MKKLPLFFILITLILSIVSTGCLSKNIDQEQRPIVQMMKKLPNTTNGLMFVDVEYMQSEPTTDGALGTMSDELKGPFEDMGIIDGSTEFALIADDYANEATYIQLGSYDVEMLKAEIEASVSDGKEPIKYNGVEIWVKPSGDVSTALMTDCIVSGSSKVVKACIDVIQGNNASLYDETVYRKIVNWLPDGTYIVIGNTLTWGFERNEDTTMQEYMGMTLWEIAPHKMGETVVMKFKDEMSASRIMKDMKTDEALTGIKITDLLMDGTYVVASAEIDLQILENQFQEDMTPERFTELYILGPEGKAANYPHDLTIGEEGSVIVGIVNREFAETTYEVEITIDGQSVDYIGPITLQHKETWEEKVSFSPVHSGTGQQVEFLLYKDGEDTASSDLHLWIDVNE